jgi:hypothetical protein
MGKRKQLYLFRGTFNYSHEIVVKYTYAPTWAAAKNRMLRRIAREHEVSYQHVYGMFDGHTDNFNVEIDQ